MNTAHERLPRKADMSYKVSLALYAGLLLSQLFKVLYWETPESSAPVIAALTIIPLLLPVYSLTKRRPRAAAWLCFIVCFYFMTGVVDTWTQAEALHGWLITLFSFLLFISAMMFTRWQGQSNRL